jgi:hypothetical protein
VDDDERGLTDAGRSRPRRSRSCRRRKAPRHSPARFGRAPSPPPPGSRAASFKASRGQMDAARAPVLEGHRAHRPRRAPGGAGSPLPVGRSPRRPGACSISEISSGVAPTHRLKRARAQVLRVREGQVTPEELRAPWAAEPRRGGSRCRRLRASSVPPSIRRTGRPRPAGAGAGLGLELVEQRPGRGLVAGLEVPHSLHTGLGSGTRPRRSAASALSRATSSPATLRVDRAVLATRSLGAALPLARRRALRPGRSPAASRSSSSHAAMLGPQLRRRASPRAAGCRWSAARPTGPWRSISNSQVSRPYLSRTLTTSLNHTVPPSITFISLSAGTKKLKHHAQARPPVGVRRPASKVS